MNENNHLLKSLIERHPINNFLFFSIHFFFYPFQYQISPSFAFSLFQLIFFLIIFFKARFQVAAEETLRERRLLESKLAPLAQENISLQDALHKSTERANNFSSELQSCKTEVHALQRRIAELDQNEIALNENLIRAQETDRQRISNMTSMERKLKDTIDTSSKYEKQYEQYRNESSRLSNDNILMKDHLSKTTNELNATQKDVQDLQTLRRTERTESERQLSLAQDDLSRLADEARIRHTEYSEQLTSNTREHQEQLHR